MGFFDLTPQERKKLLKDIESYKKGKLDVVSLGEEHEKARLFNEMRQIEGEGDFVKLD
jgi:hypothetical protein